MSSLAIPLKIATQLLRATDEFAVKTVRANQGGPFGSSIGVYNKRTGNYQDISGLTANAVLKKGIGSAHAESESLSPETIRKLETYLRAHPDKDNYVVHSSSGESCVACTAKQEITAQYLVSKGLLVKGNYIVTFGASYEDTLSVAEFDDLPYQVDMEKGYGKGSIPVDVVRASPPLDIGEAMNDAARQGTRMAAVYVKPPQGEEFLRQPLFTGYENRALSPLETAEAVALRKACTYQKEKGDATPWDLKSGTLYMMVPPSQIGALAMAESLWANIGRIVPIWSDQWDHLPVHEAAITPNRETYAAVAQRGGSDYLQVIRLHEGFDNLAQHVWRREILSRPDAAGKLYNGRKIP